MSKDNQGAIFIADFAGKCIREKVNTQIFAAEYIQVITPRSYPYPVSKEQDGKELREGIDFEINKENNKAYPLKEALRREAFPHLIGLENRINSIRFGTVEYWKERCNFLEKTIDETYSTFERDNCKHFYLILVKKEK